MNNNTTPFDEKMYDGFPYVTFIHPVTRNNLIYRSNVSNRLNTKTSWIKFTSGLWKTDSNSNDSNYTSLVPIEQKGKPVYNFGFEDLYDSKNGFLPKPGITSVEIKYLSKYGGVREATINWTTFSLDQFQSIAPYFLTPGIATLLEWGWTSDLSQYQLLEEEYIKLKNNPTESWLFLNNRAYESNCMYDGMHGIIKNFTFSINNAGGYDCTTTIISGGSLMYNISLENQSISKDEKKSNIDIYDKYIKGFVKNKLENYISKHYKKQFPKTNFQTFGEFLLRATKYLLKPAQAYAEDLVQDYMLKLEKEELKRDYEFLKYDDVKVFNDGMYGGSSSDIYVSWGFIEEIIVNKNLSVAFKSEDGTDKLLYKLISKDISVDGDDAPSIRISNDPYLRTTDLNICILPQTLEGGQTMIEGLSFTGEYIGNNKFMTKDKSFHHGYIRNIFVHLDIVKDAFENSEYLTDAILKILNKINDACGNMWNFSLKIRESDQTMMVIDENYTDVKMAELLENNSTNNIYKFSYFKGNSIIKDVSFDCSLPNSMAMTAMYGHHKENNSVVNSNNDTIVSLFSPYEFKDMLYSELITIKDGDTKTNEDSISLKEISLRSDPKNNGFSDFLKKFLPEDSWIETTRNNNVKDNNITHEMAMKLKMLNNSTKDNNSQLNDIIIPGDLVLTLEGISGLRIGDVFLIDFLPAEYVNNILFQISAIDHSIDKDGWETKINAKMRVLNTKLDTETVKNYKNTQTDIHDFNNSISTLSIPDTSVLKWIKNKMSNTLKKYSNSTFSENILAGIIYTETGSVIKKLFKNGKADPKDIVKNKEFIGDSGNAYGFFQIHKNTAKEWLESDGDPLPTWSSVKESTIKAIEILNDKKRILTNSLSAYDYNILEACISAYNQGQSRVIKNIKNGVEADFNNSNNYVKKVLNAANKYGDV